MRWPNMPASGTWAPQAARWGLWLAGWCTVGCKGNSVVFPCLSRTSGEPCLVVCQLTGGANRFKRNALPTTLTDERPMAAAAQIGFRYPKAAAGISNIL